MAGIAGLVLLLIGWFIETYQTIKAGKAGVPLEFAVLYFLGSILLGYHAFLLNDSIFVALNVIAALISLINVYYLVKAPKKVKTR